MFSQLQLGQSSVNFQAQRELFTRAMDCSGHPSQPPTTSCLRRMFFYGDSEDDLTESTPAPPAPPAPSSAIPPTLPPSVEEAYRRKCIQLKQRMNEVEEANDASRLRLVRMQRQIEKMRLERAFLLEQLAKRTSTNVEDSEGSPSPPPTPKEKPLRTKRGHRKPSFLTNLGDGRAGSAFIQQGPVTLSPSSDAFSQAHLDNLPAAQAASAKRASTNGHANSGASPAPQRARSAFDTYCNDMRSVLAVQYKKAIAEGTFDIERHLAVTWRELNDQDRTKYQKKYDEVKKAAEVDKDAALSERQSVFDGDRRREDEDVEMGDETEPEAGAESAAAGFTAVNRS
ncbi:hmg box protein [Phlyctema vagabunda]|uniref:Hmg box protein n=1 Tax=Phlyctema vagabunda TaxID=108571 RepID=A0ABR4P7G0_9HELO